MDICHVVGRCDRSDPWCRHGHQGWEQRATTSDPRIHRAWSSHPYGIGIACGPSQLLVVDTDQPKPHQPASADGELTLARIEAEQRAALPPTFTVTTPSGGTHRYFAVPQGLRLGNTAGQLGPLVDTRGVGGYVVAAPTIVGQPYRVIEDRRPAPLPAWLARLLTTATRTPPSRPPAGSHQMPAMGPLSPYVGAALANEAARVRTAMPGQRNQQLFCASLALGQLVAGGQLDEPIARDTLCDACAQHIRDGAFTTGEADATITSGLTRGAAEPRTGRTSS